MVVVRAKDGRGGSVEEVRGVDDIASALAMSEGLALDSLVSGRAKMMKMRITPVGIVSQSEVYSLGMLLC